MRSRFIESQTKFIVSVLVCCLLALLACQAGAREEKQPAALAADSSPTKEWKQLYNGRDLDGWEHVGPGRFVVEDGLLKTEGGMGLLWYTRERFGNCVLRIVYKTSKEDSNSGVFVRIADKPAQADESYGGDSSGAEERTLSRCAQAASGR